MIAENILESPTERDFVDTKNNNIWGMRDLDIRDKPEHIFDMNEPEVEHNCNNCLKLKAEIIRQ